MHRRILGELRIDLRDRAKRSLATDAHVESALDRLLDPALDGNSHLVRFGQTLPGDRASGQLVRQSQPTGGGHDDPLHDVADLDVEVTVVIDQLREVDRRLALAADVDERDILRQRDDPSFDHLPPLVDHRLERLVEHRGEVLLGFERCLVFHRGYFIVAHGEPDCTVSHRIAGEGTNDS